MYKENYSGRAISKYLNEYNSYMTMAFERNIDKKILGAG